jgi:hypothetical protein
MLAGSRRKMKDKYGRRFLTLSGCLEILEEMLESMPESEKPQIIENPDFEKLEERCLSLLRSASREDRESYFGFAEKLDAIRRNYVYEHESEGLSMSEARREKDESNVKQRVAEKNLERQYSPGIKLRGLFYAKGRY